MTTGGPEKSCGNCGKRGRDWPFLPWRKNVCGSHGLSHVGGTGRKDNDHPADEICWSAKDRTDHGAVARRMGKTAARALKIMISDQRG